VGRQVLHALPPATAFRSDGGQLVGPPRRAYRRLGAHRIGVLGDVGRSIALLFPARMTFAGLTEDLALAWCPIYPMGERGEIGAQTFVWSPGPAQCDGAAPVAPVCRVIRRNPFAACRRSRR